MNKTRLAYVSLLVIALLLSGGMMLVRQAEAIDTTSCGDNLKDYYRDIDGDGFGNPALDKVEACTAPSGYVANDDDCDDSKADMNPDEAEVCDMLDNDCDGAINEGLSKDTYYRDADNDTYGDPAVKTDWCGSLSGYVKNDDDCDDADNDIKPGANEACDDEDNDCDGTVDEGCTTKRYYRDSDGDGYGDPDVSRTSAASGYVSNDDDCNDDDKDVHPGKTETCDNKDNDCDGLIDEGLRKTYYYDGDDDSYGLASKTRSACSAPNDYVSNDDDCNDTNASIKPGATEICDNKDNDCDGSIDENCDDDDDEDEDEDEDDNCDCDCKNKGGACVAPHGPYRNHGAEVSAYAHYTNCLKKSGQISGKEKGQMQREKAHKKSGKKD
jgi:hypothetical protein